MLITTKTLECDVRGCTNYKNLRVVDGKEEDARGWEFKRFKGKNLCPRCNEIYTKDSPEFKRR